MKAEIRIKEIAKLFLKLGFIGFGGPAAHIAMMQREVVVKRKWMSDQHFLDLLGATNLIPGPNSTEMAIHIGYDKGGWKGLVVAGLCFILPAVLITGILAWFYQKYGQIPEFQSLIYGVKPAIIAVILGAIFPLAKKSIKSSVLACIGVLVLGLSLLGVSELALMFGSGLLMICWYYIQNKSATTLSGFIPFAYVQLLQFTVLSETNAKLFFTFLKIGSILYGSGYVLFAFLDAELVETGLLTRQQLMDAIAVGQFTPGPVFTSVTFIGYQINGIAGAVISTVAIFVPSFVLVGLLNPLMKKMRNSRVLAAFLDAVNVASVALIVAVCFTMAKHVVVDWKMLVISLLSLVVVFRFKKVNSAAIVIGGAVLGYILFPI